MLKDADSYQGDGEAGEKGQGRGRALFHAEMVRQGRLRLRNVDARSVPKCSGVTQAWL